MAGMVYLDNAATTQPDPQVIEAMTHALSDGWGNPSSVHEHGKRAKMLLEEARVRISRLANCHPDEVFFTSGGTEADNWAIQGALAASDKSSKHVVITAFEHHAVLDAAKAAEKSGVALTVVPVSSNGVVDPQEIEKALRPETVVVSVMHVNNELGTIQPTHEIGTLCNRSKVQFHSDYVQSFGKLQLDFASLPVDMISISAHKIHGPKGVGALIIRRGTKLAQHQYGGSRTGTENIPGIVGFGKAAELCAERMKSDCKRIVGLHDRCERELKARIPGLFVNCEETPRAKNISNIRVPGCDGEELLIALDMRGISVSTGAACSAGATGASHVMKALGLSVADARSSIRISFGRFSTDADVHELATVIPSIIERQRKTMAVLS